MKDEEEPVKDKTSIEDHMKEYFTRWPSYKDKFTHLEWYHIFLDFSDYLQKSIPVKESEQEKKDINDVINQHFEDLPNGNYKYGEPYASGVRPVYGAHQQLLWYSVPNRSTRFTDLEEAEDILFKALKIKELQAEVEKARNLMKIAKDSADEEIQRLKAENTRQGDTIVSLGKVLLQPNEREKFEVQIERLKEEKKELAEAIEPLRCYFHGMSIER